MSYIGFPSDFQGWVRLVGEMYVSMKNVNNIIDRTQPTPGLKPGRVGLAKKRVEEMSCQQVQIMSWDFLFAVRDVQAGIDQQQVYAMAAKAESYASFIDHIPKRPNFNNSNIFNTTGNWVSSMKRGTTAFRAKERLRQNIQHPAHEHGIDPAISAPRNEVAPCASSGGAGPDVQSHQCRYAMTVAKTPPRHCTKL
ncbi:hypothetical protein B0T21DRAFT_408872 [Apiosordaria backusii]|uniref:Uncharacterized protein n=1 Tax=Apiosordaria backusii TaxID=314023 RepID=A0AA40K1B2_9PEZI|nr:hypothetical protein B0T21DRAFT_408872 [Apiosordaria backusii]